MSFSLVGLLNTVSPRPSGTRRIASALRYGPQPKHVLDLYGPAEPGPHPVVVFFYGGAWTEIGDRRDFGFAARALAALGYVVAVPDYRVLPEVGYPTFLDDCALAVHWLLDHVGEHGGDPARLALSGHSAGAYNAVMLALDRRYDLRGKLRAVAGLSGPYDFYPFTEEIGRRTFGHVPDGPSTQPVNHVTPDAPPMFLGHGDRDTLVGRQNAQSLSAKLRAVGVPVEVHNYPELGHAGPVMELGSLIKGRSSLFADLRKFLKMHV
jgi:acetyl esterase/lipase